MIEERRYTGCLPLSSLAGARQKGPAPRPRTKRLTGRTERGCDLPTLNSAVMPLALAMMMDAPKGPMKPMREMMVAVIHFLSVDQLRGSSGPSSLT